MSNLDSEHVSFSKKQKAVVITKATLILLLLTGVFAAGVSLFFILAQQDRTANRILECTAPWGACYQEKAADLVQEQQTDIGAAVEYCATINNQSVAAIRECVERELVK